MADAIPDSQETPTTARDRVKRIGNDLIRAELMLKAIRDEETSAEVAHARAKSAWELAKYQAFLSPEAPVVARNESTVAEKEAWVEVRCKPAKEAMLDTWAVWKAAQTRREAAKEHYSRVDSTSMLAQSILRSIDRAFSMGTRDDA